MLFIGIGILFIIAGLTAIYFASQMRPEILIHPIDDNSELYRGAKLGEFVKENWARKVFTYIGIMFILIGLGFIYKAVVLEVPADKIAVTYFVNKVTTTPPEMFFVYGSGYHFINPVNVYKIIDLNEIYSNNKKYLIIKNNPKEN